MQKVIIPALALLIGMALGALLMKTSYPFPSETTTEFSFDQAIDIITEKLDENNFEDASKNNEYLLKDSIIDETVVKVDTKLSQLYSKLNDIFFIPACNEGSDEGITIDDADKMISNYYDSELFRVRNRCEIVSPGDVCASSRMAGWSFNRTVIDKLLANESTSAFTELNLFLARRSSNDGIGPLTLVMIPAIGDKLIAKDGLMFEYARPCPPKCKSSIIIGDSGVSKEVKCDKNPFEGRK
jgi:hypothetical protein